MLNRLPASGPILPPSAPAGKTSGLETLPSSLCFQGQAMLANELRGILVRPLVETTIAFMGSFFLNYPGDAGATLAFSIYSLAGGYLGGTAPITPGAMVERDFTAPLVAPVVLGPYGMYYFASWSSHTAVKIAAQGFTIGGTASYKPTWQNPAVADYAGTLQNQNVAALNQSVNVDYIYGGP